MRTKSIVSVFGLLFSGSVFANCMIPSSVDKQIYTSLVPNLEQTARTENISTLSIDESLISKYKNQKLKVHYKHLNTFDKSKETIILIPGGPGQDVSAIEDFVNRMNQVSNHLNSYNIISMTHRGLPCSNFTLGGARIPDETHKVRYAASDIEAIRKKLLGNKKMHVWGYSYGSVLAQTYALLFPESVDLLFIGGSFSKAEQFLDVQRNYGEIVSNMELNRDELERLKLQYPEHYVKFLDLSVSHLYSYIGRVNVLPSMLTQILNLLDKGLTQLAELYLKSENGEFAILMKTIGCSEVFPYPSGEDYHALFKPLDQICINSPLKKDYFDYSSSLHNISVPTFIWGGKFDHVTPSAPMIEMNKQIPNSQLYIDQHSGHFFFSKMRCFADVMGAFFGRKSKEEVSMVLTSKSCTEKPII